MKKNITNRLNDDEVLNFWEKRAELYKNKDLTNLSNLEANLANAHKKHTHELGVLQRYIKPMPDHVILDLGAGHCAWACEFSKKVWHIDAVEYAEGMVQLARKNVKNREAKNISIFHCAAQDYFSEKLYDTVLLSGLTIYLNDVELSKLLSNLQIYLKPNGRIILRDGTAKKQHYLIKNKFSNELNSFYSAYYRTVEQYVTKFSEYGFHLTCHEDMFPEGSSFNKREETILRIYEFINTA